MENPLFTGVPKGQAAPFGSEGLSFHNFVKKSPSRKPPNPKGEFGPTLFYTFSLFCYAYKRPFWSVTAKRSSAKINGSMRIFDAQRRKKREQKGGF